MGDALRRFFVSLGVALGLSFGQPDPVLSARVFQESGSVFVNAWVEEAFSPGAAELIEAGSAVALRFSAELSSAGGAAHRAEETRSIVYELRERRFRVSWSGGGKSALLEDGAAARALASSVAGLEICPVGELAAGGRIAVAASIGVFDARGEWHEAPVLWNYVRPARAFAYGSPSGIPR